jgi:primosomal protein N' (replication factor Y)
VLVSVALPLPLFRNFTYEVDDAQAGRARPGMRAVVPFRNRREIGIIVGGAEAQPGVTPKPVALLPDAEPIVRDDLLALCAWMAEYYIVPLGVALRCAIPAPLTSHAAPEPVRRRRRIAVMRDDLPSLIHRERLFARAPQQRALFELIESLGGRAPVEHLMAQLNCSPSVLRGLVTRGLVTIEDEVVARDPFGARARRPATPHAPSPAQRTAIETLARGCGGVVFLLHGVTGSGKTLVYLELLRRVVLEEGKSAIVLVPEIALTPQTVDRFRAVFGDQIAVLHSALSDGERYDEWLALKEGRKRIAVGARSAIFAPLSNLGAIVVDEEHESSYKQGETPRYHAREVAVVRARREGAVVVLGSATPSLESWVNAQSGKYTLLTLPDRVGEARLPVIEVIDRREAGSKVRVAAAASRDATDWLRLVVSDELESALSERLNNREQSILLLNRRGYSAFVQCAQCGDVANCPNCSISLTYHRTPERLVCHYCLHAEPPRTQCPRCNG